MLLPRAVLARIPRAIAARRLRHWAIPLVTGAALALLSGCRPANGHPSEPPPLLNVSFDVSRELFAEVNAAARPALQQQFGRKVEISQSHAGASKQARSVIDGVDADVVTLNTVSDIDNIARRGHLMSTNWRSLKPYHSAPYSSVIVFVVRSGNPRKIHDWADLVQPGVRLAMANPKTSGTARMVHLSAWASALKSSGGDESRARAFVADLYARAPVLDTGSRGATITFVQRRMGDALITLEAEQRIVAQEYKNAGFEVIYPGLSVDVEMPVAVVERVARKHGSLETANAYLDFLYTPRAQEIIARNHFRPRDPGVRQQFTAQFPNVDLVDIDRDLGGWDAVMVKHFAEGGVFDQAYGRQR